MTCSISSATENTAVIYGEKGKIVIPYFWSAKEAFLEGEEGSECFNNFTLDLAKIMDEVREQIGIKYPFE